MIYKLRKGQVLLVFLLRVLVAWLSFSLLLFTRKK